MSGQPVAAAWKLAGALADGDELAARKACVSSAWKSGIGARWRAFGSAGEILQCATEADVLDNRARVPADVLDATGAVRRRVHLLLMRRGDSWKVAGLTSSSRHAWIFLARRLDAILRWEDSPAAATVFGRQLVQTLAEDDGAPLSVPLPPDHPYVRIINDLRGLRLDAGLTPALGAVRGLEQVSRYLVELRFEGPKAHEVRWLVLGRHEQGPELALLIDASGPDDLDTLLIDLEPDWAELETDMSDENKRKLTQDEARTLVNSVVTEAMKEMGYPQEGESPDFSGVKEGDLKGKIPELVYNLLQSALTQQQPGAEAPAAEEAPVVDLAEEGEKKEPRTPSAFDQNIGANLSSAVSGYIAENVTTDDGGELKVDAEFVKDHGPQLFANVFGAFVKSIVPEDMKIEVPVTTSDDSGAKQVHMKLDVGDMLAKVLAPVERGAAQPGSDAATEGDEPESEAD